MKAQSTPCQFERIDAFLDGNLSDIQLAEFEKHLDSCRDCDAELTRRTADGAFWNDAKQFLSSAGDEPRPDQAPSDESLRDTDRVDQATERSQEDCEETHEDTDWSKLSFLDPTDDPHMLGRFGGYEISGVIGRGGMGVVMKGWDVSLDRFVAIKVLNPAYTGQSASRQRFAREAQAAAAVLHDNVIAIYGVDRWNDMPFLVMPYIKGESLQQRIDRAAPLPLEDILGISLQIARGLAAAHDQGLVHRDIKPANILMPASVSRVIITDFGLARTADDASLTRSGVLAGTPQYMSPEQSKGEAVDGRTDLFSLGSVMYAMACGHPPFRAETPYGVLRKITDDPHRPLSQVRDDTPVWFEKTVDRLLAKNPDERFQTATELADFLEDCLAHIRQPTTTLLPKLESPPKRKRVSPAAIAASLVCVALVVYGLSRIFPASNMPESDGQGLVESSLETATVHTPNAEHPTPLPVQARGGHGPSDADIQIQNTSHLSWEFDDSQLDRLESELGLLLHDTAEVPFAELKQTSE